MGRPVVVPVIVVPVVVVPVVVVPVVVPSSESSSSAARDRPGHVEQRIILRQYPADATGRSVETGRVPDAGVEYRDCYIGAGHAERMHGCGANQLREMRLGNRAAEPHYAVSVDRDDTGSPPECRRLFVTQFRADGVDDLEAIENAPADIDDDRLGRRCVSGLNDVDANLVG